MENDTLFRILATIVLVIGAGISIYFRRKADVEDGEKITFSDEGLLMTISLRLLGLAGWLSIFAWLVHPTWMNWSRIDLPEWLRWVGLGMGVIGDLLAWGVFSNLGNNVTPTVITRKNAELVTSGPYKYVRHPLYLMGLIAYNGFALLAENWFIALATTLGFILLTIRADKEEQRLIEKFGDAYKEYMKTTGRFFPRLSLGGKA